MTKRNMDVLPSLTRQYVLGGRRIANRFVAQAMEMNCADPGGAISEQNIERYRRLARGRWGMVFVEAIAVAEEAVARPHGLLINRRNLDGLKKLVDVFKSAGDSLLLFQITHAGREAANPSRRATVYDDSTGIRHLAGAELERIRDQFTEAVALCREAGADGVDIKSCHGYLLCETLRPLNRRSDSFGGDLENRARLLTSILEKAQKENPQLILGTRLSLYEGIRGGCGTASPEEVIEDLHDILAAIDLIISAGAHFLNISAGIPSQTPHLTRPERPSLINMLHHFRYTRIVKDHHPDIAVIGSSYSAGGEESPCWAAENIERGYTDFAGFGRQSLADPHFPVKLMNNRPVNYCTTCGGCSRLLRSQKEVYCVTYERPAKEDDNEEEHEEHTP
jgi:2,4-dienoyl-CoA reductase-like NADH-dependent reductase (Old Yellow Enzyme family)